LPHVREGIAYQLSSDSATRLASRPWGWADQWGDRPDINLTSTTLHT